MAQQPKPKQKSEIHTWLDRLVRWLRSLLGIRSTAPTTVLSRRYSSDKNTALFTLERLTVGSVQTWRLTNARSNGSLLITLDNLNECKAFYRTERTKARQLRRSYETTPDERALYLEGNSTHSHRFSFSWISWEGQRPKVRLLGVWDGDFAGLSKAYGSVMISRSIKVKDESLKRKLGNAAAAKIGEMVAKEVLELKALPGFFWEERVQRLNWEELLRGYSASLHGSRFDAGIRCRS